MGLKAYIADRLLGDMREVQCFEYQELWEELAIRNLYFWACVNMVSNAISKCEFKTFDKGNEVKSDNYYLFNVTPNKNQNSSEFIDKMIAQLFSQNEVLIVQHNGQYFVADSFGQEPEGLNEKVFDNITVGKDVIKTSKKQSNVIFTTLSNTNVKLIIDTIYETYQKLISYGIGSYKLESGNKGFVEKDATAQGKPEDIEKIEQGMNEKFQKFFKQDNAAMLLPKGYKYVDMTKKGSSQTQQTTRDIKAMFNDIASFTATGFNMPPKLLTGEVENTSNAMDQFLTLCINPLADTISKELSRKLYTKEEFLAGSKIVIDTKSVKHVDLLSVSTAIDKLISSGAFTINDVKKAVGDAPIPESFGDTHFMTKNYSTAESINNGGGGNE